MDPQDQQPDRPVRPPPARMPYVALQERAERVRRRLADVPASVRELDDRRRTTSFVPQHESVQLDVRRSPVLLLWPLLRTVTGVVALAAGTPLEMLLLFAAATAIWSQTRLQASVRRTAAVSAVAVLVLLLVGPVLGLVLLLVWAVDDVADWACDRLVVTDKRIYRRHGVLTQHAPSIALTAIAFIDASVPPLGRLLGYGTLRLDSVAQRDAPLARLDLLPDVTAVSHEVLRLRAAAMPKYPQQPY